MQVTKKYNRGLNGWRLFFFLDSNPRGRWLVHQFNEARALGPVLAFLLFPGPFSHGCKLAAVTLHSKQREGEGMVLGTGSSIPFVRTEALL